MCGDVLHFTDLCPDTYTFLAVSINTPLPLPTGSTVQPAGPRCTSTIKVKVENDKCLKVEALIKDADCKKHNGKIELKIKNCCGGIVDVYWSNGVHQRSGEVKEFEIDHLKAGKYTAIVLASPAGVPPPLGGTVTCGVAVTVQVEELSVEKLEEVIFVYKKECPKCKKEEDKCECHKPAPAPPAAAREESAPKKKEEHHSRRPHQNRAAAWIEDDF